MQSVSQKHKVGLKSQTLNVCENVMAAETTWHSHAVGPGK